MQLDDMRERLHDLAERVPDGSTNVDEVFFRTRRAVSRRRVARGVASLVLVGLVVSVGVVVGVSGRSAKLRITASAPTTTEPAPKASSLTDQQLRAHDGIGVPAGWSPVDEGDARVWVPDGWTLEQGSCIGESSAAGMISIGKLPNANCTPAGQWPTPKQAVALIPSTRTHAGKPLLIVHGYRVYDGNPPLYYGIWNYYEIPQLGVRIATRRTLSSPILNTLAPSARKVALAFADQVVPSNWHAVTKDGVSLSIPPSWVVVTPLSVGCGYPNVEPELLLIKPTIGVPSCPLVLPRSAQATHDGVSLYLPPRNPFAPRPAGQPLTTLRHGTTAVSVYAEMNNTNALDLLVRRAGSAITHILTIGLGRDGRIAAGVLASIEATT